MPFTLATWKINFVPLSEPLVTRCCSRGVRTSLCLQECQVPSGEDALEAFAALGYRWRVARAQKGYNRVASCRNCVDGGGAEDQLRASPCAHGRGPAETRRGGSTSFLRPRPGRHTRPGGEREVFGQKLDYLARCRERLSRRPARTVRILVGDLNIAPREGRCLEPNKQLLKIVSHTPIEVERLGETQDAGAGSM